MRKVIVSEFITMDGVIQSPGYPDEDRTGGFEARWLAGAVLRRRLRRRPDRRIGRDRRAPAGSSNLRDLRGPLAEAPADDPLAAIINALPKYVVHHADEPLPWENSHVLPGRRRAGRRELKEQEGKDLRVIGSGELVQTLMERNWWTSTR